MRGFEAPDAVAQRDMGPQARARAAAEAHDASDWISAPEARARVGSLGVF